MMTGIEDICLARDTYLISEECELELLPEDFCRWCVRHRCFYGNNQGYCEVCETNYEWSGAEYRVRAIASTRLYGGCVAKRVLLTNPFQFIILAQLAGSCRAIIKRVRYTLWHRLLLGTPECGPSDSELSPESDPEEGSLADFERASRPCPNPLWKLNYVLRRQCYGSRPVIFLVIDFLWLGALPHHFG